MKDAGIKVWVLTGDKIETAVNIGVSCGLLDSKMELHYIDEIQKNELNITLKAIVKNVESINDKK